MKSCDKQDFLFPLIFERTGSWVKTKTLSAVSCPGDLKQPNYFPIRQQTFVVG